MYLDTTISWWAEVVYGVGRDGFILKANIKGQKRIKIIDSILRTSRNNK